MVIVLCRSKFLIVASFSSGALISIYACSERLDWFDFYAAQNKSAIAISEGLW